MQQLQSGCAGSRALDSAWHARAADRSVAAGNDPVGAVGAAPPPGPTAGDTSGFLAPLVKNLMAIECPQQRSGALQSLHEGLGFPWLAVATMGWADGRLVSLSIRSDNRQAAEWEQEYLQRRYFEFDPRLAAVATSSLPCQWDLDSLCREARSTFPGVHAERLAAGLMARGMRSGVMFGICCETVVEPVLVSLTSRQGGRSWMSDSIVGRAMVLAMYACEHHRAAANDATLSQVQRQILQCLRQGLGDKVIADRLGLTTHNVDYHLRRLRQKFGVRNRVQLVKAAAGGAVQDAHVAPPVLTSSS